MRVSYDAGGDEPTAIDTWGNRAFADIARQRAGRTLVFLNSCSRVLTACFDPCEGGLAGVLVAALGTTCACAACAAAAAAEPGFRFCSWVTTTRLADASCPPDLRFFGPRAPARPPASLARARRCAARRCSSAFSFSPFSWTTFAVSTLPLP